MKLIHALEFAQFMVDLFLFGYRNDGQKKLLFYPREHQVSIKISFSTDIFMGLIEFHLQNAFFLVLE